MPELAPQQRIGPYAIVRKIAEGGMAEIYLASRDGPSGFSKLCVLKRIREDYRTDAKFRRLFENEARIAARLEHANIVQIFDLHGADDGELFLAMQWVDGCSLSELKKRSPEQRLPARLAAFVVREVASALTYAQSLPGHDGKPLRLLHRDISPQNILISRMGEVRLTDFGIARPMGAKTSGGFKGKVAYMAPEQAREEPMDVRTDLFALGTVFFELCTGARPFDLSSEVAHIREMAIGSGPAPRADDMGVAVPAAIADTIEGLLQRRPARRTASPEELCRQVDAFLRTGEGDPRAELAAWVAAHAGLLPPPKPPPGPLVKDTKEFDLVALEAASGVATRSEPARSRRRAAARLPVGIWRGLIGTGVVALTIGAFALPLSSRWKGPRPGSPPLETASPLPEASPRLPASPIGAAPSAQPAPSPLIAESATGSPPKASASRPPATDVAPPPAEASIPIPVAVRSPVRTRTRSDSVEARSKHRSAADVASPPAAAEVPGSGAATPVTEVAGPNVDIGVASGTPYATFTIDGTQSGETPARLTLHPGVHEVVFAYAGQERRRTFTIRPGDHLRLDADFSR